ncbi:MAG: tRNA (adenine(22)-N(1))-methyltransferase [Shewanella sp.]
MKISQRLQQLDSMIREPYDHIWDCCCDHGLLGMSLLKRQAARQIHFVDCAAPLMAELEGNLQRFFPGRRGPGSEGYALASWQVHCMDVAKLPLTAGDANVKHLIIIAGVGGELLVELVEAIVKRHQLDTMRRPFPLNLEFILCPVHHHYHVRRALRQLGLQLRAERWLEDNGRYYEILHLLWLDDGALLTAKASTDGQVFAQRNIEGRTRRTCAGEISPAGRQMWQGLTLAQYARAQHHLHKIIGHYQRIPEHKLPNKAQILTDYHQVLAQLTNEGDCFNAQNANAKNANAKNANAEN